MTTKGSARHNDTGLDSILSRLPDMIARCEEAGLPVVVTFPPTLDPATQRLLATLGVTVRFTRDAQRLDSTNAQP